MIERLTLRREKRSIILERWGRNGAYGSLHWTADDFEAASRCLGVPAEDLRKCVHEFIREGSDEASVLLGGE